MNPGYEDFEGYDPGEEEFDPSLAVDPAGYPQQPYYPQPNYAPPNPMDLVNAMAEMARVTAAEQLQGPLGRLTQEAEARENVRITELVDETVSKLEARHPGVDWRDESFVEFAGRFGLGDAASSDRLANQLEEARIAFDAVRGRQQRAEATERNRHEFARIKNAQSSYRVGPLE